MPNAKPFPLYTDGTNIYTSFDGGVTFITISSGGGGTIHTSAPLSGDGSVGTPATIAAGAIALTKLATQADQTALINVSGGAASPVAGTAAQLQALAAPAVDVTMQGSGSSASKLGMSGWWADAERFLKSKCNPLTEFAWWKAGVSQLGGPTTLVAGNGVSGAMEGGSIQTAAATVVPLSKATVWQTPNASAFGMYIRAKFVAAASNQQSFGMTNGTNQDVAIALDTDTDATHWYLQLSSATPILLGTADTSVHDIGFVFDPAAGTPTVAAYVDGVLSGSTTVLTGMPTTACFPYIYSDAANQLQVSKAVWAYVAA